MTKRDMAIVERYENATARTLYDVYDNYSHAKANAFEYCKSPIRIIHDVIPYRFDGKGHTVMLGSVDDGFQIV